MLKHILLSLTILSPAIIFGQSAASTAGTSSALFLRSTVSTRVAGLSEAYVAIADDENALLYNPAGLGKAIRHTFALNHTEWLEDIRFANLIYVHRINNGFAAGISIAHMYMPDIPRILDASGVPDGSITVSSTIVDVGTGYHLFRGFYVGAGIKYFHDNLAGNTANGIAFDAGIYSTTFLHGLTFGASAQNLGGEIQYVKDSFKIPFTYRAGLAYKTDDLPLQIGLDVVKSVDSELIINLGSEYTFNGMFFLLAGNQFRTDSYFTPTFGAGLTYDNSYSLFYSFSAPSEIGFSHRIGIKFEFGSSGSTYVPGSAKVTVNTPAGVSAKVDENNLSISWQEIAGAYYHVYAKNENNKWTRLTKTPIRDNFLVLKNPKGGKTYRFCVTSVVNGSESSYSREAIIYVKN
jgi:hypothetical protein